jgi:hypothetical protein
MPKLPNITSWLNVAVQKATGGRYEHALAQENGNHNSVILPQLKQLILNAHEDARKRLRKLATGSLDPMGNTATKDPAQGYPEKLHIQTLKGYFGEVMAGVVAENFDPFGMKDWIVAAYLFRFHLVEFQQLSLIDQTGEAAKMRPGRTGDDCLAFRRDAKGNIVMTLFCEAKCTADHDAGLINDAHEKSSLTNLIPVDILQIIEVLEDSTDSGAPQWIEALRKLYLKGAGSPYERVDQVTYICGRKPAAKGQTSWIPTGKPHSKYTGSRRLHVAEIHLNQVEDLVKKAYGVS